MENLIVKLNFYKVIPYLVDQGIPTLPSPLIAKKGGHSEVGNKKRRCARALGELGAEVTPGE